MATAKAVPAESKSYEKQEEKWRAEADCRTLIEAAAIRKDKARFARAQACAKEQLAAMQAVVTTK